MIQYLVLLVFPAVMIFAAINDLTTLTIPNRLSLLLVGGFLVAAVLIGMAPAQIGLHLATGLGVLMIGFCLFSFGYVGGGDAKLLAAASLWIGHAQLIEYIGLTGILGGVLALMFLLYRQIIPPPFVMKQEWAMRLHQKNTGIPYGIAITIAALWLFPSTVWFTAGAA